MKRLATVVVALVVFLLSSRAEARPGVRLGIVDDPDEFFAGFFYEIPLGAAGPGVFVLDPGVDLGIGDEFFSIRGQLNAKYFIPVGEFFLYPLMGLSVMYVNADCGDNRDCDDTEAGLNIGLGFAFLERFNLELYATVDHPDLTFSFGFVF